MNSKALVLTAAIAFSVAGLSAAGETVRCPAQSRKALEMTIYNNDLAYIKETRSAQIPAGEGTLEFGGVPTGIISESVHLTTDNPKNALTIYEQSYAYDLVNPSELLSSFVGKKIKIMRWNEYQDRKETVDATLLSADGDGVYQIGDEIYLGHPGTRVLPYLAGRMRLEPSLLWRYGHAAAASENLKVSYLATGFSWKADYNLLLGEDEKTARLSAWGTIKNNSGTDYEDARLTLLAGGVQRTSENLSPQPRMVRAALAMGAAAAPMMQESPAFEYHAYDVQKAVSLPKNQSKQIELLETLTIPVKKEFEVQSQNTTFYGACPPAQRIKQPVRIRLEFENNKTAGPNRPLPAGTIRVYQEKAGEEKYFVGEDTLPHTAVDTRVRIGIGEAFDITAEKRQTSFAQITNQQYESAWEVTVKNRKNSPAEVLVYENFPQSWHIVSESQPREDVDAFTVKYRLKIRAGADAKLAYRVRIGI